LSFSAPFCASPVSAANLPAISLRRRRAIVGDVFRTKQRRAFLQLDGKSLTLPQRLSADGARYAKGGITFWIKGKGAQLKRPKSKWTQCQTS